MNQHFNSVHFFKCNDLVTENCLFVSLIDFRLSKLYHYITKITFYFLITIEIIKISTVIEHINVLIGFDSRNNQNQ